MPLALGGYGDRRRDRSEGTIRNGACWPIKDEKVTSKPDLLLDAAMRCDIDEVGVAIAAGAEPTDDGPLLIAAQNGGALVVQHLAELGANVNAAGTFGKTPLMWAAEKGHADVCAVLIAQGAHLDTGMQPAGHTALHMVGLDDQCPLQSARSTADMLLRNWADTTLRNQFGATAAEYHRKYDQMAKGRDKRGAQLAQLISGWERQTIGLLRAMQRLVWMRLLNRHPEKPEFSYGADSPAYCVSGKEQPYGGAGGSGEILAQHICHGLLRQPSVPALHRHQLGMRDRFYFETLPSFQLA